MPCPLLHRCRLALVLALAAPVLPALAAPVRSYPAVVAHVTDGDTVWVRPAGGGARVEVRLQGIDAPEICQSFGPQARQALARRLQHQRVTVRESGRDAYGRVLGRLQWSGQDVGGWMVGRGLAWSSGFRAGEGPYRAQQAQARQAGRGLWAQPRPLEPRRFRQAHGPCVRPAPR